MNCRAGYFWLMILLVTCLFLSCDTSDDDTDNDGETDVDAVTTATPERADNILKNNHPGYRNPDCYECHKDPHQSGFVLGECSTCHGGNGAPRRTVGHENADCISCHTDVHANLEYESPAHCTACHKYEENVECPVTEEYDVVVIGAGGGGLGAAAMLAKNGLRVALVEKHYKVGGYMTRFHRGDYSFEVSLHAMGGLDPEGESRSAINTFETLGILDRLQPVMFDPMYRSVFPDMVIDIPADVNVYREQLKALFPHEARGIDRLFKEMEDVAMLLDIIGRIQSDFSLEDLLTILKNLGATVRGVRYLWMDLDEMVSNFVTDPKLKGIFLQLVTYVGGGPKELQTIYFIAMWQSYHLGGFHYFIGGSQSVSEAMADVVREHSGVIKLNTLAEKIVIENGRAKQVQTKDDACLTAKWVISNANAPDTMLKMVGEEYLPEDYVDDMKQMEIGVATFQVFLGVDNDYSDYFHGSHEITINESWDMDENYMFSYEGMIEKAPFILANYTKADPTTAPEGKNAILMTTYMPFEYQNAWGWNESHEKYDAFKNEVAQVLIERAEEILPGLSEHIEIMEVSTPITNYGFSKNPGGTIYGFSNIPSQGTIFRPKQQTPIENLLLAGAWTFPGGGQSAVISSGVTAAKIILEAEGFIEK